MITVVHGSPQTIWCRIKPAATIYVGSLVGVDSSAYATDEGLIVRPVAAGVANTTNEDRPFGVCVGTNLRTPNFDSTYLAEKITDPGVTGVRSDSAEYVLTEGTGSKNNIAEVEVAIITPSTVLRAPIRNNAIGTAITLLTSTAGNANGLTVTTNANDIAGIAGRGSIYCRTGLNAGQYRWTDDTSSTVHAWDREMLASTANTGETYVKVGYNTYGEAWAVIGDGTVASFLDAGTAHSTAYDIIWILRLDLSEAGNEYAEFMFDGTAFNAVTG